MELEEAIEDLKKFCEYDDNLFLQDEKLYEYQDAIETVLQTLNNHINRINKLQKESNEENKRCSLLAIENNDLKENSIPKKRIKNEIEILKAQCGGNPFHIQQTLNAEIRLLQELLEDK